MDVKNHEDEIFVLCFCGIIAKVKLCYYLTRYHVAKYGMLQLYYTFFFKILQLLSEGWLFLNCYEFLGLFYWRKKGENLFFFDLYCASLQLHLKCVCG